MYQITALYEDCEIEYAEGEDMQEVLAEICEQISDSVYTTLSPDDIDLHIIKEDSIVKIICKASLYW